MPKESLTQQKLINKLQIKKNIAEIPGWGNWTATQVKDQIEKDVIDLISVKKVLKDMAQMLILLRDGIIQ